MRKVLCMFLTLSITMCLAACVGDRSEGSVSSEAAKPLEAKPDTEALYLVSQNIALPDGFTYVTAQCAYDGKLWLGGQGPEGAIFASLSTEGYSEQFQLPDGAEFVYAICAADDSLTMLAGSMPASYTSASGEFIVNEQPAGEYFLWTFKNGCFSAETPLIVRYDELSMIFKSLFEYEGKYYSHCQDMVVCWGEDGSEIARYSLGEQFETSSISSMCFVAGEIVLSLNEFGRPDSKLVYIDATSLEERKTEDIKGRLISGLGVDKEGLLLCTDYGIERPEDGILLTWDGVYLPEGYSSIEYIDGVYLLFVNYQTSVTMLEYSSEAENRISLTVATDQSFGSIYTIAKEFNESQRDCYVTVKSYDALSAGTEAMTLLRSEALSGKGPDLFAFTQGSSLSGIREESYLLELGTYATEDFCEQTFVPGLIEAMETGNGLYWIPYCFSLVTFTAPGVLEESSGNVIEYAEALLDERAASMFPEWCGRETLMSVAANFSTSEFLDMDLGISRFSSQSFINLMQFVEEWTGPATQGEDRPGLFELETTGLFELETISSFLRLAAIRRSYNGDYMFVGFPTLNNSYGMYQLNMKLAISGQCEEKEAAWKFISYALSEQGQALNSGPGFPALASAFYGQMYDAIENGVSTEFEEYEYSQGDADKLLSLLRKIDTIYERDTIIVDIILSESESFFSGMRTAEQVADAIQDRVSIYLAERS